MDKTKLIEGVEKNLDRARDFYKSSKNPGEDDGVPLTLVVEMEKKTGGKADMVAILADEGAVKNRWEIAFDLGIRAGIEVCKDNIASINAVYSLSEAWVSSHPDTLDPEKTMKPSEDPKRKEVLLSSGMSRDGISAIKMFDMKRSIDLETGKLNIEFVPSKITADGKEVDMNQDEGEPKAYLLQNFWLGVTMMEEFSRVIPEGIRKILKNTPSEEIFQSFHRQLEKLRKQ